MAVSNFRLAKYSNLPRSMGFPRDGPLRLGQLREFLEQHPDKSGALLCLLWATHETSWQNNGAILDMNGAILHRNLSRRNNVTDNCCN